jgi:hypothetical protein
MSDSPPKKGFEVLKERFIEKLDIFDMDISSDEEGVKKHIKKTVSCASQFQEFSSFGGNSGLYNRSQGKRNTGNLVIVNKSGPTDQAQVLKAELVHSRSNNRATRSTNAKKSFSKIINASSPKTIGGTSQPN